MKNLVINISVITHSTGVIIKFSIDFIKFFLTDKSYAFAINTTFWLMFKCFVNLNNLDSWTLWSIGN